MPSLSSVCTAAEHLGREVSDIPGLRRAGWLERYILTRVLKREQVYRGPSQDWLSRTWDLRLGTFNGLVFKVALEAEANGPRDAIDVATTLNDLLTESFSHSQQMRENLWMWHAEDGNVVMQVASLMGVHAVMLFLTANIAKTAELR